jgi:hypothetical protein
MMVQVGGRAPLIFCADVSEEGQFVGFENGTTNIVFLSSDLVGKVWNAPNTALGVLYGTAGTVYDNLFGKVERDVDTGHIIPIASVTIDNNAIQFINNPWMRSGITMGNTIIYSWRY